MLSDKIKNEVLKLKGPIVIFGAGGFIGSNLFKKILALRNDVYAVTSKTYYPWRIEDINPDNIIQCNILHQEQIAAIFEVYKFNTIFDFAAYGAYSKQDNTQLIYDTNFKGLLNLLEVCSELSIKAIVHAGTSSEYGLNAAGPKEDSSLTPNSHYAVSKIGAAHLVKYYGQMKELNICNLRYYSIYGPFEEPDRLIPQLIEKGLSGTYPNLVQPNISRDFVFIDDAIYAALLSANNISKIKGDSINIASNNKITIKEIVELITDLFALQSAPKWGDMPDRKWDLTDWFGDSAKAEKTIGWKNETTLKDGLALTADWQKKYAKPLYEKKLIQDKTRHKLSAVIACYKDNLAIPYMYERLTSVFKKINVDYEIIFVNDCSPDNTSEIIQGIVNKDYHVTGIEHSRNFGSQSAFLSGMEISTGDAVILLDGDLQDPPELIESFYEKYISGYDVIYGKRVSREGNQYLAFFYKIFYRIFRNVSYIPIPLDAGDFSLMDRKVVTEIISMPETDQFLRGLRAWVGFKQVGVDYVRPERMFGTTTNNLRKNISWAKKAIFSFSFVPLELLSYAGWFLTLMSFLAIVVQILLYFLVPGNPHGITTLIVLILFFGGIQMLGISIIGEYQGKILEETKKRPKYIRKKIFKYKSQ